MAKKVDDTELEENGLEAKARTQADQKDAVGVNHRAKAAAAATRGQDDGIGHINRGHGEMQAGESEDEKRAAGTDASTEAGPHDFSPEANRGGSQGGLYDTYAHAHAEHPNVAGSTAELALGQAPVVPAAPMAGSDNVGEQVQMDRPNAINQSPRVVGVDLDPRNDPAHPLHGEADKDHPDFGKPANQHKGRRAPTPTYDDVAKETAGA